jgi:hypothetical protein
MGRIALFQRHGYLYALILHEQDAARGRQGERGSLVGIGDGDGSRRAGQRDLRDAYRSGKQGIRSALDSASRSGRKVRDRDGQVGIEHRRDAR